MTLGSWRLALGFRLWPRPGLCADPNSPSQKRTEDELESPYVRLQPNMNKVLNSEPLVAYALTFQVG
jgi:hypothetical protein